MELTAEKLINKTLLKEGGYCNVAGDSGGMTYKGIAYNYHKTWAGWPIVKKHLPLKTGAIIKDDALDKLVIKFYEDKFYLPSKCDKIDSPIIRAHLYDMGVNAGLKTSAKIIQKAVNTVYKANLVVDGVLGSKSLSYINNSEHLDKLEDAVLSQRIAHYKSIGTGSRAKFLKGWISRANDIQTWAKQFK